MSDTQSYIGTPNGVVLCVDRINAAAAELEGCFWHGYSSEPIAISHTHQLVMEMEKFFDEIHFPFPTTNMRSFTDTVSAFGRTQEKERVMSDEKMLQKRGDLGTFIIRVQHRQNSSWQGRITWVEEDRTVNFRSIWEMIKLVESALDTVDPEDAGEQASW